MAETLRSLWRRRLIKWLRSAHNTLNDDDVFREGLLALATVAVAFALAWWWDGQLAEREEIRENIRFVRQVDIDNAVDKPFQDLDLSGATLSGLDLSCRSSEGKGALTSLAPT